MSLRRIFSGTVTGAANQVIVMALQIALVPAVIRLAGAEANGAFTILMQLVGWGAVTSLGLGVAAGREMARSFGTATASESLPNTLRTVRAIYWATNVLCALFVAISAYLMPSFVVLSSDAKMAATLASQICLAGSLYAAWIVLRTPWTLYGDALRACLDIAVANVIAGVSSILRLCLAIASVFCGMSVVGLALSAIVSECLAAAMNRAAFYRLHPQCASNPGSLDWALMRSLLSFGTTYLLIIVSNQLATNTTGLAIGYFCGAFAVSVAYASQMPALVLGQLIWKIADSMGPFVNQRVAHNAGDAVQLSYLEGARWSMLFALPLAVGVVYYNQDVIRLWVGRDMFAGQWFTNAIAVSMLLEILIHFQSVYFVAIGKLAMLGTLGVCANAAKLLAFAVFGQTLGLTGMAWVTAASQVTVLIFTTWHLGCTLDIGVADFAKRVLFRPIAVAGACAAATVFLRGQLRAELTWYGLCGHTLGLGAVWLLAVVSIGLTSQERVQGIRRIKKSLRCIFVVP